MNPHASILAKPALALALALALAPAATAASSGHPPPATPASAPATAPVGKTWHARHGLNFQRNWGIDVLGVRRVSSGFMLRFDYRVVNPERASALVDRKVRPYIVDEATGAALAVPAMENIGELRQVAPLQRGRTYYVVFGNPGGLVKRGGRVTLVIGSFQAEGLVVE